MDKDKDTERYRAFVHRQIMKEFRRRERATKRIEHKTAVPAPVIELLLSNVISDSDYDDIKILADAFLQKGGLK